MTPRNPWILSRSQDLIWFHGSVLAGLLLLACFALLPPLRDSTYAPAHPAVLLLLLWGVVFDGTHVWGTYARSYLAPDADSRRGLPARASWSIIFVGPIIALLDAALLPQGPSQLGSAGWLFGGFLLFAYLYAYWHLVRQHYGLLVLYQRRLGESSRLDAAVLWLGCLYPYLRFALSDDFARSGLPVLFSSRVYLYLARLGLDVASAAAALVLLILLARRFFHQPERSPGPRELLLATVISFHMLVFSFLDNLLTITATLTIFHNLQYHRIVWQHERGHGRIPSGSLARYLACGLILGGLWYGPRVMGVAVADSVLLRKVLLGLGWGVAFHHYLVDGRIWRVRRTPSVAQALDRGARS
jgi:hypothetical protein